MAYIVPREIPKSCNECQFHYCSEYHPFWSADKDKRNTKTIRCQASEPFRSTVLDIKDESFKADWCPLVDATDVVPKSEVERLTINMNAFALTAKRLKEDVDRLQEINERDVENIRLAKAEVAREIFEEIEESCMVRWGNSRIFSEESFAELKKKYTEGET